MQFSKFILSKEEYIDQLLEKIIEGLLVMYQELETEKLYDLVNSALLSLGIELNYDKFNLHLKSISEKNQFNIFYPSPSWIAIKIINAIELNQHFTLDYGSDLDVLPLLQGFLKLNHNVKLSDILKEIKKFIPEYEKGDIIRFISLAVANGLIRATVVDEVLTVNALNIPELELDLFAWENKILYGMFVGLKQVSTKNLSKILNIDKSDATNIFYKFIQQTDIDAEITRGGDFVVRNLPIIPPLDQIQNLSDKQKEMLGYLRNNKSANLSEMETKWAMSSNDLSLHLFELIGSGFIRARIGKKQISNLEFMVPAKELPSLNQCFTCETMLKENETICSECGARRYLCGVCKGVIFPSDIVSSCPHCENPNHTDHILLWLNVRRMCPLCRRPIEPKQLKGGII